MSGQVHTNYDFDTRDLLNSILSRRNPRGIVIHKQYSESCLKDLEEIVDFAHDWMTSVVNLLQPVAQTPGNAIAREMRADATTPAAKALAARLLSAIAEFANNCGIDKGLMWDIFGALGRVMSSNNHYPQDTGDLVIGLFNTLYMKDNWMKELNYGAMSGHGMAEVIRWSMRRAAKSPLWGMGAYEGEGGAELIELSKQIKNQLVSDSEAVPDIPFAVIKSIIDNTWEELPHTQNVAYKLIKIAEGSGPIAEVHVLEYLLNKMKTVGVETLEASTVNHILTRVLQIFPSDSNVFSAIRDYRSYSQTTPPFVKICKEVAESKPEVFSIDGGNLLKLMHDKIGFLSEYEASWGSYKPKLHIEIADFLRSIPTIMPSTAAAETLCEKFKTMSGMPPNLASQLMGMMMHNPTKYGLGWHGSDHARTNFITALAKMLGDGSAHAELTERGCEIFTEDGLRVLLAPAPKKDKDAQ